MMTGLGHDLRYAFRQLRRSPGFTLAASLTLALGIAATTTVFSFVDAALLRPLPYPDPSRLFMVWSERGGVTRETLSYPNQVAPTDSIIFLLVSCSVAALVVAAAAVPARRAARTDPMTALRAD